MGKRLLMTAVIFLPMMASAPAVAESPPTPIPTVSPAIHAAIDVRWTTSLVGTVLTNPVRFPTHRGFAVLHISEHQADSKAGAPFTLAVAPHCVELARKTTSDEVIITPFDDGSCILTITDQTGTVVTANLYVGSDAIAALTPPSPVPTTLAPATALPVTALPTSSPSVR